MTQFLNVSIARINSLRNYNKWGHIFLIINILLVLSSCRISSYERIGSQNDYKLSETEKDEISFRLFIASEIDEYNMPLNDYRKFEIENNDKLYYIVNWFNLNIEKYLVSIEWLDQDNKILSQTSYTFMPENMSWFIWHNKKMSKLVFPEGKIIFRVKLNNQQMIEEVIDIKYIEKSNSISQE